MYRANGTKYTLILPILSWTSQNIMLDNTWRRQDFTKWDVNTLYEIWFWITVVSSRFQSYCLDIYIQTSCESTYRPFPIVFMVLLIEKIHSYFFIWLMLSSIFIIWKLNWILIKTLILSFFFFLNICRIMSFYKLWDRKNRNNFFMKCNNILRMGHV